MGIPSFTRWLIDKYKSCTERALDIKNQKGTTVFITKIKKDVDLTSLESGSKVIETNFEFNYCFRQSSLEFDNLYIDMQVYESVIYGFSFINVNTSFIKTQKEWYIT